MTLAPGDPTLWNGVIFVRSGPYASAILRFQIRFPSTYPNLPPLVTFSTDIFHPLIVPLTTFTFSTSSTSEDPVSATDEERLPPGGFSLRHGFPHWFGRAKRSAANSETMSRNVSGSDYPTGGGVANPLVIEDSENSASYVDHGVGVGGGTSDGRGVSDELIVQSAQRVSSVPSADQFMPPVRHTVPVAELLNYIRSTLDDETVLDSLPLKAAGNPGAWHAWKAHRRDLAGGSGFDVDGRLKEGSPQTRLPGDWHWDGIWARRVESEVEASRSDAMLFGNAARGNVAGDERIRFSRLDDASVASIKELMILQAQELKG